MISFNDNPLKIYPIMLYVRWIYYIYYIVMIDNKYNNHNQ